MAQGLSESTGSMRWDDFEKVFGAIGAADLLTVANNWNTAGGNVTNAIGGGGNGASLADMKKTLTTSWQSGGAQVLYDNVDPMVQTGTDLGKAMTTSPSGAAAPTTSNSMAGIMAHLNDVNARQYKIFQVYKGDWDKFLPAATAFFNSLNKLVVQALNSGGQTTDGAGGTVQVGERDGTPNGHGWNYAVDVLATFRDKSNHFFAQAVGTTTDQTRAPLASASSVPRTLTSPIQLTFRASRSAGGVADAFPTQENPGSATAGSVQPDTILNASVDEYLYYLRQTLAPVAQAYTDAKAALPPAPARLTYKGANNNGGGGGNQGGSAGANGPLTNVPVNKNGSNVPVNNGVNNGQNNPLTSANGANSPLNSANGANGANSPLSQSGLTPTSLASAPVTTPTGLSGLNSGVPTNTAGLSAVPPVNGIAGGLPGLGNAGSGVPMFIPPVAGGILPNSELGSGLPGEFGGAGGSGLSEGALDGGLANGEFGANGELNPGGAGALGEGALAAEVAPGAAAAELGSAARGTPMMPFMPMSPMMGGSDGGERRRTAWLDEDEDIWAADTDPAPAVIGGGDH